MNENIYQPINKKKKIFRTKILVNLKLNYYYKVTRFYYKCYNNSISNKVNKKIQN